jgi:undecaprenyl pyrophosphate phosphatase UppP
MAKTNASIWLSIVAGILAVIGTIVNLGVDRDNVFDMTTSGLFIITFIVAFVGAYLGIREMSRLERKAAQKEPIAKTA